MGGTAQPSSQLNREPAGSESRTVLPAAQVSLKFSHIRMLVLDLSVGDRAVFGS